VVLTAASCSPWCAGLVSHHHPLGVSDEVRRRHSAGLISASGDRDHTTWPSALTALVSRGQSVHRIPRPTFVTTRTPLRWERDAPTNHILLKNGSTIFSRWGLNCANILSGLTKIFFPIKSLPISSQPWPAVTVQSAVKYSHEGARRVEITRMTSVIRRNHH